MTIRWLRRPRLDISSGREPQILLLCGIPALMAYVATMMGIGLLGLSDMLGEWNRLQAGTLTLQLPADTSAARTEMALAVLRQTSGIAGARLVEPAETKRLLEPWLGPSVPLDQLPVPRLVDLRVARDAVIDFAALRQKLTSVAPGAELEERPAGDDGRAAARRAVGVLGLGLTVVAMLGVMSLGFAIWGDLARHRHVIELLHRLGADDGDIAAPFQMQALLLGLLGGAGGAVAGALTLLAIGGAALALRFSDWQVWAVAIGVASATGLMAMAAARVMVLRRLAHMP